MGSGGSGAVLEAPALVAGLDDVAMMGQPVEQRRRHLGVAEHARPFAERQVRRHDHRGLLVEPTDQVEQQLPASLGERQVAEFVEDDEVLPAKIVGQPPLAPGPALGLKSVDQIDDIEEPASGAAADARAGDCDGEMDFPVPVPPTSTTLR